MAGWPRADRLEQLRFEDRAYRNALPLPSVPKLLTTSFASGSEAQELPRPL